MRNREERRAYEKKIHNDKRASKCPICKHISLFYSVGELKPEAKEKEKPEKEDFNTKIICESCGATVYEGEEVGKLVPPGIYLPLKLDIFEYALRHPQEEEKDETNSESV